MLLLDAIPISIFESCIMKCSAIQYYNGRYHTIYFNKNVMLEGIELLLSTNLIIKSFSRSINSCWLLTTMHTYLCDFFDFRFLHSFAINFFYWCSGLFRRRGNVHWLFAVFNTHCIFFYIYRWLLYLSTDLAALTIIWLTPWLTSLKLMNKYYHRLKIVRADWHGWLQYEHMRNHYRRYENEKYSAKHKQTVDAQYVHRVQLHDKYAS